MGFTFDPLSLTAYTDEMSFSLISEAVLTTDLMGKIAVRSGLSAGTVAINLMTGDLFVTDRSCGFDNPQGDINFTQVDITIVDKQIKMEVCPNDLREYYLSQQMSPSAVAGGEQVPFEEVIANYYIQKIKNYNEGFLINGDGVVDGLVAQLKASSATVPAGAAVWTPSNAIDQALDLYDAIGEEVKDRSDLIMVVSPTNYRMLVRALVAADLYNYKSVTGNEIIELPGTNLSVVKSSGLNSTALTADFAFAGPAEFIVAGTGLTDDMSSFGMFYAPADDVVKVRAYWRLGVAVYQANLFAHNNL